MKRLVLSTIICALSAIALASQLDVLDPQGKKMGTGTFTLTRPAGKVSIRMVLNLTQMGGNMTMDITSVYSAAGDPISQSLSMSAKAQGNSMTASSKATYSGRKATIVSTGMGNTSTKTATSAGPVRDLSILWSTGKVPAVGTKTTFYQLDPMSAKFEKQTATYQGTRNVKVGKRTVSAHVITSVGSETTKYYFTSNGDLVKLEGKQFTLVQR